MSKLTSAQIAQYQTEGYVIYKEPVLPPDKFTGLQNYFETILAGLPPDAQLPRSNAKTGLFKAV